MFGRTYAYLTAEVKPSKPTRIGSWLTGLWKLTMLWLAVAGTVSLALWCLEEGTQTASMAIYNGQKAGDPQVTANAIAIYDKLVEAGRTQNEGIGTVNPLTQPAYRAYFGDACKTMSDSVKARLAAETTVDKNGTVSMKAKDAPPQIVKCTVTGETEKSFKVEGSFGSAYLPKSQVKTVDGGFEVPAWLVKAKKLDAVEQAPAETSPVPTDTAGVKPKTAKGQNTEPVKVEAELIGETEKSFKVQQGEVTAYLPKSLTTHDGKTFTTQLWLARMKKLAFVQ